MKTRTAKILATSLAFAFVMGSAALLAAPAAGEGGASVQKKTLWSTLVQGGWVMIPIGICSVLTVYLAGDGTIRTSRKKSIPADQEAAVKDLFRQGDYVGAYQYCKANPSPFTNVIRAGVSRLGDGKTIVEEGILGELSKENSKLQSWISYLSVIGVCTPMIGLLGTVVGMIDAFEALGQAGIGDPSALSAAIGHVLVATASGLAVAIPAFGFYYYLRNRTQVMTHDIQALCDSLFRKMPYESFAGAHVGDEELYAADPNWVAGSSATGEEVPA